MANNVLIYKNLDALKPVENLVEEAVDALGDPARVSSDNDEINAALSAAGGAGIGAAVSYAALYYAGVTGLSAVGITSGLAALGSVVGGGMLAGVAILAAPIALLGIGGYALAAEENAKKLVEAKELLLQEVLRKHAGVIKELKRTANKNAERVEYLTRLNTLLQAAIRDLQADMKAA